ncbi:DUF2569 family protein [Candidatus Pacearchaeota archaeon]|nr:DUF2569 family protein [Candidatus Pacearchaeota archaeon]
MTEENSKNTKSYGFGGWMILIQLILCLNAFYSVIHTIQFLTLAKTLIGLIFFFLNLIGSGIAIYSVFLMYKEHKDFPMWAIISIWYLFTIGLALLIVITFSDINIASNLGSLIISFIFCLVITGYLRESKQVKNTFSVSFKKRVEEEKEKRELERQKYAETHQKEVYKKEDKEFYRFLKWVGGIILLTIIILLIKRYH